MVCRSNISLPCSAFLSCDGRETRHCASEGRWDSGLHADLDCFERTETNVGNEFGGGGGGEVEKSLVSGGILFADRFAIDMLEVLVEAILASTLDGVADECGTPTCEDASKPFSTADLAPCFKVALVQERIDLSPTFDKIEGCDGSVSCTLP